MSYYLTVSRIRSIYYTFIFLLITKFRHI
jgi:hypothetical protein